MSDLDRWGIDMEWQPIAQIPSVEYGQAPLRVLIWGSGLGVQLGAAANYPNGYLYVGMGNVNGNLMEDEAWRPSHFMNLPAPPSAP